jgi:hypothetical protein
MRLYLPLLATAMCSLAPTANAGAATATSDTMCGEGGLNGCSTVITYRAAPTEGSRILARSTPRSALVLIDSAARIDNHTNPSVCTLHGPHTLVCSAADFLTVEGGNRGDIIDAARFAGSAVLHGGKGDDKLYAPRNESSGNVLYGGGGDNLLVGDRFTTVSYANARGPVTVDLLRGFGIAPGERDRIAGVGAVEGGRAMNRLFGNVTANGYIVGGPGVNILVSRMASTQISLPRIHQPSTVTCTRGTFVYGLQLHDLALGPCRVRAAAIQLLLPLRSLRAPVLEIARSTDVSRVSIRAAASNALIGETTVVLGGPAPIFCSLSATGQRLLRHDGRLVAHIEVFSTPLYPGDEHFFSVILTRPR